MNFCVKIKICGITNMEDACAAAQLGANYIGFILYPDSPRAISMKQARDIRTSLSKDFPEIQTVAVFVNPNKEEIQNCIDKKICDIIQLSGNESPSFCSSLSFPVWKAIHVKNMESLQDISLYQCLSGLILDTYAKEQFGGTGTTFNPNIAIAAKKLRSQFLLAGGLNPENIQQSIEQIKPWGIDISSGIEEKPGKKSIKKMQALFQNIQNIQM